MGWGLKYWPRSREHSEDKFWRPWPRNGLALASKMPSILWKSFLSRSKKSTDEKVIQVIK